MKTRPFGRTCPATTELTFGAMRFAANTTVSDALLYALEKGVRNIDTARVYGESEAIIARTLREWSGPAPFISTKVAPAPGDWRDYCPLERAFTPRSIRESVETSLTTLGLDSLDLVYLHQWYYLWTHRPEWLETFTGLRAEGKIKAFGISAQDHEHDALLQVVDMGLVDAVQLIINVFESRPLVSLIPLCAERNVGVMGRCVLDDGGLTGEIDDRGFARGGWLNAEFYGNYRARLDALQERFCADGSSLAELAIRFALTHPAVSTLTLSMQDKRFVDANVAAVAQGPLPPDVFDTIRREFVWTKNFFEPQF
jgi:aryl-alcohol dehydrogenase-like predicted oxidoreductase